MLPFKLRYKLESFYLFFLVVKDLYELFIFVLFLFEHQYKLTHIYIFSVLQSNIAMILLMHN